MTLPDRLQLVSLPLLERYWVQEVIAHGGMSVVYRGMDQRLLRPVCIKVFDGLDANSQPAYTTGRDHFVQEAFALSRLTHPNTVRIYDFGFVEREPALPFQVSEWVGGGTLHQRVRKLGPLALGPSLTLLEPIVGALAEAHAAGIVHRDVKPSNILLVDGPRLMPKLADFGIAKAAACAIPHGAETAAIDCGRILLYSPGWSAPEQLRGQPITPASDVFSFGLLIAFVLGGRALLPPGTLTHAVQNNEDLDGEVARALDESPLPADAARVVARACRMTAAQRYQTIEELWAELSSVALPEDDVGVDEIIDIVELPRGESEPITRDTITHTDTIERSTGTFVAGGRMVRVVETSEQVELLHGSARVRVTLLATQEGEVHLHVKGVNCFVARAEGRPTGALALKNDDTLQLYSPERRLLAVVRCGFGSPAPPGRTFKFGASSVRVPQPAVLIDFAERQELLLIQQSRGA